VSLTVRDGTLAAGIAAGALFGIEFLLIFPGLQFTAASRATLFIYTAPFFVALGAGFLLGEKLRAVQWAGLLCSFAGLVVAFGVPDAARDGRQLIGDLMMLGAGAAWGATTLVIKATRLRGAPAEKLLVYQLAVSIPMLALGVLLMGERMTSMPSGFALGWLAYQTFWVVSLTYAVWFALVQRYSASRLSAFTFLTPLFGVASGHFVLGEPISVSFGLAVALVIGGLILVNRPN
jgi:drug/metabolite transporter (DMT)-like permease